MKKLFVIDAVNFLFRSYYAISSMTNPQGESTNALFGFIRSINKLIHEFSPDYFIAIFDGPDNKKSRTAIYSDYKGHRKEMPKDLVPQINRALEFCELAGIPCLSSYGVEADDTMGSIAKWMEAQGVHVFLCSGDKDLCQLVSDTISVINPQKDNLLIDRDKVKELFGVTPEQLIDYLAIMGDASDNIPGLEGFGSKTAVSLLNQYGSLEKILDSAGDFKGKKREILEKGREIALISKQLATIQTQVEFPQDETFFHLKEPDLKRLKAFYQDMHFVSLLKELGDTPATSIPVKAGKYHLVDTEEALLQLISKLQTEPVLCIDTETTSTQPLTAELVGIGLGVAPEEAWYIPLNGSLKPDVILNHLKPLLQASSIRWIGHNIKYDLHVLEQVGICLGSIAFDTILASYLITPHLHKHSLDDLALEQFQVTKTPISSLLGKGKEQRTMREVPLLQASLYCCEDVDYTLRLKQKFEPQIEALHLDAVLKQIELPLIAVLARLEKNGIFCNQEKLKSLEEELKKQIETLQETIYELAGETFNLNSPKQLSHILFEKMGIKPPKKTTTGFSTAIDVLESLRETAPIVEEIIRYRTVEKLRSTYVEALPTQINPQTGRIHCNFNQTVAATGRLSSQDPNLQNIPVRSEEGKKIRAAFEPQSLESSFLSADYSQIELRLLAHLSEDPSLLKAFHNQEDIHTFTAAQIFDKPLVEVTAEMRNQAKTVNFGILYGQQAFGLSKQLGTTYSQAEQFIKTYFDRYPKIKDFLEFCKESARKTGRSITLTGRLRPIPEITSKNPALRAAAERLAINTPLQGTAADLIKIAMIQVDTYLQENPHLGKMVLQIHDELLFESPDPYLHSLSSQVKKIMEGVFHLNVPLVVDISIGKNWGAC